MSKVDKRAANALISGDVGKVLGNTDVAPVAVVNAPKGAPRSAGCFELRIFGNGIAIYDTENERLYLRNCGYETVTTKNRVNAVLRAAGYKGRTPIYQRDHKWKFDGRDAYDVIGKYTYREVSL